MASGPEDGSVMASGPEDTSGPISQGLSFEMAVPPSLICLDYFKDPVSIGCGHNFCRECVTQLWGGEDEDPEVLGAAAARPGPEPEFGRRGEGDGGRGEGGRGPAQRRSWARAAARGAPEAWSPFPRVLIPEQGYWARRARGSRWWAPPPPLFVCPQCRRAFPPRGLRPNFQLANMVPLIRQLRPRGTCPRHDEALKLFCEVDREPICVVCRESRSHRRHRVVPLDEAPPPGRRRKRAL